MGGTMGDRRAKLMTGVGALAMFLGASLVIAPSVDAGHNDSHDTGKPEDTGKPDTDRRVDICHATGSETNPFVLITVDFNAEDGTFGNGVNDHSGHPDDVLPGDAVSDAFIGNNCEAPGPTDVVDPDDPVIETVTPEASLEIVKVATGEVPDSWTADFAGDLGAFSLTSGAPSTTRDGLTPGTYTVTETAGEDFELVSVSCVADDGDVVSVSGGVAVDLADGDAVSCTFTNDFEATEVVVLDDSVERPVAEDVTPDAVPETEVLGETVQRLESLPRTGHENQYLAGGGLVLLGAGLLLAGTSRRRQFALVG